MDLRDIAITSFQLDHIPLSFALPACSARNARLAIWQAGLGGCKECHAQELRELAAAGFFAVSFDNWQHGARASETAEALCSRVLGDFRRHLWPIIGQSALDALRVIDWAITAHGCHPKVCIGGVSLGGHISVAVAGLDPRVVSVAAVIASPDWNRPGMLHGDPPTLFAQGQPDAYARHFYTWLNPLTNLARFAHCPAIAFELGAEDTRVPPDGAQRFQAALRGTYECCPERMRVTLHPGVGHAMTPAMWQRALAWFADTP